MRRHQALFWRRCRGGKVKGTHILWLLSLLVAGECSKLFPLDYAIISFIIILFSLVRLNGNKEFYSIFPKLGHEVFEKPLELYAHSNVICMNSLNTVIANAIERSKLGEAGFAKHDIFSSPALVDKIRSDDI
jgi:hypothetical protein